MKNSSDPFCLYKAAFLTAATFTWAGVCLSTHNAAEAEPFRPLRRCGVEVHYNDSAGKCFAYCLAPRRAAFCAIGSVIQCDQKIEEVDLTYMSDFWLHREITGLGRKKDRICDVRCFDPKTREMRYLIWLNAETGAALIWGEKQMKPVCVPLPRGEGVQSFRVEAPHLHSARLKTPRDVISAIEASWPPDAPERTLSNPVQVMCVKSMREDVSRFAKQGDRVWEAIWFKPDLRCSVVWMHAETGRVYFLTEQWREGRREELIDVTYEQARTQIVKVCDATDVSAAVVRPFAFSWGRSPEMDSVPVEAQGDSDVDSADAWPMMGPTDGVGVSYVTTIGFDVQGFARRGDRIWECELSGFDGRKLAIWVNPSAGKKLFVDRMLEQVLSRGDGNEERRSRESGSDRGR